MVHLKSIWESIWGTFWSIWGPFWGPFESMLKSDSDFGFRSPWDQISRPLGPILALLLDPMLAHVGSMLEAVGRLEGSLGVSGPI